MGGANNICSDKTGTLTQNKMSVTDIWIGKEVAFRTEENLQGKFRWEQMIEQGSRLQGLLIEALCCNTSGTVGDASATENAMLLFMQGLTVDVLSKRQVYLPEGFTRFHFTSARKKMSTIL
jgi:magnesium-transporting ATPase (P-type)